MLLITINKKKLPRKHLWIELRDSIRNPVGVLFSPSSNIIGLGISSWDVQGNKCMESPQKAPLDAQDIDVALLLR